jgi:hypothetical protein
VKTFNAAEFDNGLTLHASVTDASVGKYMVRTDAQANPSADNAAFAYTSGDGNDTFNINISKANLAASGTANREDFSMSVSTGAGNDRIEMQIGDGVGTATDAWFINHVLMDANADSRIGIDAGEGNDYIHTYGATAFRIDAGAGNDAVYTDNSGASKAVWVLNEDNDGALQAELLTNLRSDANDSYALFQQTVNVTYKGYTVSQVITDFNTTDLEMNNIIKGLIAGDEHLRHLIKAEDGPGNILIVSSLIDGVHAFGDFAVSLTANTAVSTLDANTIALFNAANNLTGGAARTTQAQVQTEINNGLAAWNTEADYDSELATLSGGSTSRTITFTGDAVVAANFNTTTVTIGGVVTVVTFAANATAAQQATAVAAELNAVEGITAVAPAGAPTTVVVTAATGAVLSDVLVTTTLVTAVPGPVGVAITNETAVVEATGANSIAENDNTITDGTGNDTIVLSTDATSSETVVLVSDGVNDLIVNFQAGALATGGDVVDFDGTLKSITGAATVVFQANATNGSNLDAIGATTTVYELATQTTNGTAAGLVAELGTAATNADIDAGDTLLFVAYTNTGLTQIWRFVDANGANVDAAELTLEATFTGITPDALDAANFV